MLNRADRKRLNQVMKKALTQVGAFLVNPNTVRFEQEWMGGQHDRNSLIINGQKGSICTELIIKISVRLN